jgi:hypothetical protein
LQRRLGNTEQVIELAQQRVHVNPHHVPSLAALVWAYGQTGELARQRQVCQRLVSLVDDPGLCPQAPELAEARQVLQATA